MLSVIDNNDINAFLDIYHLPCRLVWGVEQEADGRRRLSSDCICILYTCSTGGTLNPAAPQPAANWFPAVCG